MKRFDFWQKWLLVFGALLVLMAIIPAVSSLFGFELTYINSAFWETREVPSDARAFQNWIYGVYGGMAVPYGLFIIFVASKPFKKKERWAWNCLLGCFLTWYIIDTSFSVAFRVYANALSNTILFGLLVLPLIFTRRDFA